MRIHPWIGLLAIPPLIGIALLPFAPSLGRGEPEALPQQQPICFGKPATIVGTNQEDVLTGTPGNDVIWGGNGDDTLSGEGGDDLICGGNGQDKLFGGEANDKLDGGNGDDSLEGGPGDDELFGGRGADRLDGGPGTDLLDGGQAKDTCLNGETLADCEDVVLLPPIPENFSGVADSADSISWSWDDVEGESGYQLHDQGHNLLGTTAADVTSLKEDALTENTSFTRHVHAVSQGASSEASNPAVVYTRVRNPMMADITPLIASQSEIEITVAAPPNPLAGQTGCQIERSSDNVTWIEIKPFSNSYVFTDAGIGSASSHRYRIRYRNGDGVTTAESASKALSLIPAPLAPLAGFATNDPTPELQWTPVAGKAPFGYEAQIDDDPGFSSPEVQQSGITSTIFAPASGLAAGTYFWRVRGVFSGTNPGAFSPPRDFSIDAASPGAVTLVSPVNGASVGMQGLVLDWDPVPDPAGVFYRLQVDDDPAFGSPELDLRGIPASHYAIATPLEEGNYHWRVQASDAAGNDGPFSTSEDFILDLTPPSAVQLLAPLHGAALQSAGPIELDWSDAADPAGVTYRLQIDTEQRFDPPVTVDASDLAESSFTTNLEDGAYVWRVHALDGAGNSSISPVFAFTIDTTAAPCAPLIDLASARKTNDPTPTISGTSCQAGLAIKVYFDGEQDAGGQLIQNGPQWSYTPSAARPDAAYTVAARSENGAGESPFSNSVEIRIDTQASPPSNLTATPLPGQVHLSWIGSPDADVVGYEVFRKLCSEPDSAYTKIHDGLVVDTRFRDDTVSDGTQHCYRVRAVDNTLQEAP